VSAELRLRVRAERLAICPLGGVDSLPPWVSLGDEFVSVTRDAAGLTVVCAESRVPDRVPAERGWRALEVVGPLPLTATGVLASIAGPLSNAGVPIFVVSSHATDHCLVAAARLEEASTALSRAGHRVEAE
jgi:hypothetical protein